MVKEWFAQRRLSCQTIIPEYLLQKIAMMVFASSHGYAKFHFFANFKTCIHLHKKMGPGTPRISYNFSCMRTKVCRSVKDLVR